MYYILCVLKKKKRFAIECRYASAVCWFPMVLKYNLSKSGCTLQNRKNLRPGIEKPFGKMTLGSLRPQGYAHCQSDQIIYDH